jgi:hypothetical protein
LLVQQPAHAGEAKSEFKALDADSSSSISVEEAQANEPLAAQWGTRDANGDSQIDEAEFAVMEEPESK